MNDVYGNIRIGKVSSINPEKATARVYFEDRSDLTSYDMPIVVPFTCADKVYHMPVIDEHVLCLLLPNDTTQGFIIGSYYSNKRNPPVQDENKFHIVFEDGTSIEYDKKEHKMNINCVGDISIDSKSNIAVTNSGRIDIEAVGEIKIKSKEIIKLIAPNPIIELIEIPKT